MAFPLHHSSTFRCRAAHTLYTVLWAECCGLTFYLKKPKPILERGETHSHCTKNKIKTIIDDYWVVRPALSGNGGLQDMRDWEGSRLKGLHPCCVQEVVFHFKGEEASRWWESRFKTVGGVPCSGSPRLTRLFPVLCSEIWFGVWWLS